MAYVNPEPVNPNIQNIVNKYIEKMKIGRNRIGAMADTLEVSKASVSMWSRGKSVPSIFWLLDIKDKYSSPDLRWYFAIEILNIMVPGGIQNPIPAIPAQATIDPCEVCGAQRITEKS